MTRSSNSGQRSPFRLWLVRVREGLRCDAFIPPRPALPVSVAAGPLRRKPRGHYRRSR